MKRRNLIRTLELPPGFNARTLAESLTEDFNVSAISGSDGEVEVQLVSPAELVVVLNSAKARFYIEPILGGDDDYEDEEDDPHGVAEEMSFHLERCVGKAPKDEDEVSDETTPDDDNDKLARRVMTRLLDEGLLELVTPRSRVSVEGHLAHILAHGRVDGTLCDDLADVKGVAELYASDEQLYEIIAACRKKRAAVPATKSAAKAGANAGKKVASSGKPTLRATTSTTRKTKPSK